MISSDKVKCFTILIMIALLKSNGAVNNVKKQDAKCLLPMEPGPCRMSLSRFYYNANTDTCEEFKFGGCKGNDNKFGFKQTCEAACKKSTAVASKVATSPTPSTTRTTQSTTKQLKSDTLAAVTANVVATTSKPSAARTTVKIETSTLKGKRSTAGNSK